MRKEKKTISKDRLDYLLRYTQENYVTFGAKVKKEEYEELIIMFSEALDSLLDATLDAEIKNEYLKRIIDKIEFSRENGEEFILDLYLK